MNKFFYIFIFVVTSSIVQAKNSSYNKKDLPLFEGGVGTIFLNIPDYPASSHSTTHILPFPAGIYRGDSMRADDDGGARRRFFNSERLEINLSFGLAPKARSKDNPDRQGMPDLDTILEVGPGLIYHFLKHSDYKDMTLDLSLPLRFAFSTDLTSAKNRGFVFNPFVYFRKRNFLMKNFGLFLGADTRFATKKNLDNFYSVTSAYSTPSREMFDARAGYLGTHLSAGLNYFFLGQVSSFIGYQYSTFHHAVNKDSPLFKQKSNESFVVGFIWWFYKSKERGTRY